MNTEERAARDSSRAEERRPALTPLGAFAVVLALAALAIVLLVLTRDRAADIASTPTNGSATTIPKQGPQLVTVFRGLRENLFRSYEEADVSLVGEAVAPGTSTFVRVRSEIARLDRKSLYFIPNFRVIDLSVIEQKPERAVLREVSITRGRFVNHAGKDVSVARQPERQVIHWTLRRVGGAWRIANSAVVRARKVSS